MVTSLSLLEWQDSDSEMVSNEDSVRCLTKGWDAVCNGVSKGGSWSLQERTLYINCLELLAANLAMRSFLKGLRGISVLLQLDTSTAVAYINNLGGTVSPALTYFAGKIPVVMGPGKKIF